MSQVRGLQVGDRSRLTRLISTESRTGLQVDFAVPFPHSVANSATHRASRQGLSALTSESSSLSLGQLRDYMDTLLKTILHPTYQAPTNAAVIRETLVNLARYARALEAAVPRDAFETKADPPPLAEAPLPHEEAKRSDDSENPTIEQRCTIVESVKRSLVLTASSERYFGPASSIAFVLGARKLAQTSICGMAEISPATLARYMRPHFWTVLPVSQPVSLRIRTPFDYIIQVGHFTGHHSPPTSFP